MIQQNEFNFGESRARKEDGINQAESSDNAIRWNQEASRWFFALPLGAVFCLDDLVKACGLPSAIGGANSQNAVGAWINGMAKTKFIRWTGRMVRSERILRHAGESREWEKIKG